MTHSSTACSSGLSRNTESDFAIGRGASFNHLKKVTMRSCVFSRTGSPEDTASRYLTALVTSPSMLNTHFKHYCLILVLTQFTVKGAHYEIFAKYRKNIKISVTGAVKNLKTDGHYDAES